ncbi:hypothetical protein, partial [Hoeflea sp.]|uniref:hypothetical protein n=1 Tax=Hoeflea sp. TaxID=1940281 RepID=UPI0025BFC77B
MTSAAPSDTAFGGFSWRGKWDEDQNPGYGDRCQRERRMFHPTPKGILRIVGERSSYITGTLSD